MRIILLVAFTLATLACKHPAATTATSNAPGVNTLRTPEWAKNAVIYEANIRQFSKEGTFNAFAKDLPRIKDLGVDIIWLMPVYPISDTNRKCHEERQKTGNGRVRAYGRRQNTLRHTGLADEFHAEPR